MFLPRMVISPCGGDVSVALVDAVEAAQQRGLAAAGGADQRGDDPRLDVQRDVVQGLELAIPEVQSPGLDAVLHGRRDRRGRH